MITVTEKTKMITIKIIKNESENDFAFFQPFSKIPVFNWYTVDNYRFKGL